MVPNISSSVVINEVARQYMSFKTAVPYGDIILIGIGLMAIFLIIGSVAKGIKWVLKFLSGFVVLCIFAASFYFFLNDFGGRLAVGNQAVFILGVLGILLGLLALLAIVYSFSKSYKVTKQMPLPVPVKEGPEKEEKGELRMDWSSPVGTVTDMIKGEKSVLAVVSYVMITEFGIFSSKTTSAPDPQTGVFFFMLFLVGAFFLIKFTYSSFSKGLSYMVVAMIFGFILSILLGYFWIQIPLETLLSIGYFATDSLVAFVSGVAVSLLMCGRS